MNYIDGLKAVNKQENLSQNATGIHIEYKNKCLTLYILGWYYYLTKENGETEMMTLKLSIENKIGNTVGGNVREYRKNPQDINLAVMAGAYYAKKNNERIAIVEGNSYMNKVYHIARESEPVSKFTAMKCAIKVIVVEPNGECFYAIAE